jgi:ABC-type branched-subunit amino acid transport system ATPase component
MLDVRNLDKSFGAIHVTRDVSMSLQKGERRVILGPNGAGKTTLFNLLVGELKADKGQIVLGGEDVSAMNVPQRARRGLSRSYQKNMLFDPLSIRENLTLAASVQQGSAGSLLRDSLRSSEVKASIEEVAERVNLADVLDRHVSEVSYGMRRQLEVGLALATRPRVLLMDEPTSGIGPEMQHKFHDMLNGLPRDLTMLIIEHDMDLAFDVADTVTVLNYGQVVFDGAPQEARDSDLLKEIYLGSWDHA